jgi:hypothetical protein
MSNFVQPGLWERSTFQKFFDEPIKKGQTQDADESGNYKIKTRHKHYEKKKLFTL